MCFSKLNSPFSCEVALPPPGENWLLTITRSLIATFHRRIRSGTFLFLKTRWRCETWKWKLWCNKIYLNWIWQKFNLVFFGDLSSKIWSLLTKCQRGISESFQNWRTYLGLLYKINCKNFHPHTIVKNLLEPSNDKILEKISERRVHSKLKMCNDVPRPQVKTQTGKTMERQKRWRGRWQDNTCNENNKLAKLRRHASRVHFAKIHFG